VVAPLQAAVATVAVLLLPACGGAPPAPPPPASAVSADFPGLRLGTRDRGLTVDESDVVALGPEPFSLANHTWLTPELECADYLNAGHYRQDLTMQNYSKAHFDNCAFDEALSYVDELVKGARAEAGKGNARTALFELGRAMHALQDFYAHSNYVELMEHAHPTSFADVRTVDAWTSEGHKRIAEMRVGMLDGVPLPGSGTLASEVFGLGLPKHCPDGTPGHAERAKDSADTMNGKMSGPPAWGYTRFQAARALARAETVKFLAATLGTWTELKWACGNATAFLTFRALHPQGVAGP
jgi:hypothetical protein